jgi:hypothetical protein
MFMKRNLLLSLMALFAACNSNPPASTESTTKPATDSVAPAMPAINSPYPIEYSSSFAVDAPKNAESVLTVWKDWESGKVDTHKDLWADSVTLHTAEGYLLRGSRDSIMAAGQRMRNMSASSASKVIAVTALTGTDKAGKVGHWVLIWGTEINTDKKGKVDSTYLQETWGFNDVGKINVLYQYKAAPLPPKKKM